MCMAKMSRRATSLKLAFCIVFANNLFLLPDT